jgi:hypothetical protein
MYACIPEIGSGFFEGDAIRKIGIYFSRPTPHPVLFADGSMSAQRVRWFSEQ